MFGKKKKSAKNADESAVSSKPSKKEKKSDSGGKQKKKSKKNDGIGSVLHESVTETILGDFQANRLFTLNRNGETTYVGILLRASDIGGLSKKDCKDEAKGSIVELINSGSMKALVTQSLMEENVFVFVPDVDTLSMMSDFSLLENAPYEFVYVSQDGTVEYSGVTTTMADVSEACMNNTPVSVLLPQDEPVVEEEPIAEDTGGEPGSIDYDEESDGAGFVDYEEEPGDVPFDDGGMYEDEIPDEPEDFSDEPSVISYDEDEDVIYPEEDSVPDTSEPEPVEAESVPEITDEQVQATIRRRLYSTELGLEVSSEPFDVQFLHLNEYVPFTEDRGDGFLQQYVGQMARDANAELRKLHHDNLFQMRERYFSLLQQRCSTITNELDISNPDGVYYAAIQQIDAARAESLDKVGQVVSEKKDKLNAEWNAKLEQVAEDAARAARQQYRDRYLRQHEEDVFVIEANEQGRIQDEYQQSLRELHDNRRQDAATRLDLNINETLAEISTMYAECIAEENARYKEWEDRILKYIDDNRKDEIARAEALAEELARSNKAEQAMAECTKKMQLQQAEFEAQIQAKRVEMETEQQRHLRIQEERDRIHAADVERERQTIAQLHEQIDAMQTQMVHMDEIKGKEYAARIAELKDQRDAFSEKYDHLERAHKHSNVIATFLCIVAVIAALAVGFVAGEYMNMNRDSQSQQAALIEEFNRRMDDITVPAADVPTTEAVTTEAPTTQASETTQAPDTNAADENPEEMSSDASGEGADEAETSDTEAEAE